MEHESGVISEEQHARERRLFEEQHECEQRQMRIYADYTLVVLEPVAKCDLEKQEEWTVTLQHILDQNNCQTIVWGHDIKFPERIVVIIGMYLDTCTFVTELLNDYHPTEWSPNTPQQVQGDAAAWRTLENLLESLPRPQHIALNPPGLFKDTSSRAGDVLLELIVISGGDDVLNPPDPLKLFALESLAMSSAPVNSHFPDAEFSGYAQGTTQSTSDGQRTIAILFGWVDEMARGRFMNPHQHSSGPNDAYDKTVASHLRHLQARGALIDSYLCYLRKWLPPAEPAKHRRHCTIL